MWQLRGKRPPSIEWVPRPLRPPVGDGLFHVTARGNRGQSVFLDDADRRLYMSLLQRTVDRYGWLLHAYCLMDNHVHIVIETPRANLSEGMQYLNGRYAQTFNCRHRINGHMFQGRFHSVRISHEPQLLAVVRYIALNPVRAGMCVGPADWPWASYPALIGRIARPHFLQTSLGLGLFGPDARLAIAALVAFVTDAPARASP